MVVLVVVVGFPPIIMPPQRWLGCGNMALTLDYFALSLIIVAYSVQKFCPVFSIILYSALYCSAWSNSKTYILSKRVWTKVEH